MLAPAQAAPTTWPFYPITSTGMPLPGADFVAQAIALGDPEPEFIKEGKIKRLVSCGPKLTELYYRALYEPNFTMNVKVKSRATPATFVRGHLWGYNVTGPRPAKVMVIGKLAGQEELSHGRHLVGPSGQIMLQALEDIGCRKDEFDLWYITSIVKHGNLDPSSQSCAKSWVKNCALLLEEEFRLVRPDYVLCLGAESAKAVITETFRFDMSAGQVFTRQLKISADGEPDVFKEAKIMACLHPAFIARQSDRKPELIAGLRRFVTLSRGGNFVETEETVDHRVIYKERHLEMLIDAILAEEDGKTQPIIAIDCEWHGEYPTEPGAWLRTIQFSHKPGFACCISLRRQGGEEVFQPKGDYSRIEDGVARQLKRLLCNTSTRKVRIAGHHLRADLPWITLTVDKELGEQLLRQYDGPATPELTRTEGGFDTMLACHAVTEAPGPTGFKLEIVALGVCGIKRYDIELQKWKKQYCSENNLTDAELEGYGECPDEIIEGEDDHFHPDSPYPKVGRPVKNSYGCWDADATRRLVDAYNRPGGLLDLDQYGNCSREAFWESMRAAPAVLEMEMTGILIDRRRGEELTETYTTARDALVRKLRKLAKWETFNTNSSPQCRTLLFGCQLAGVIDKTTGETKDISPAGSVKLNLEPVKTSGKPARPWAQVVSRGEEHLFGPSTDKEVLGIMRTQLISANDPRLEIVETLRNIRFAGQVIKSVLRPPLYDEEMNVPELDDDGDQIFEKGLLSSIHSDGRVRTHMFQTKETGRMSSARPPLMNLSKRRETDYRQILGKKVYKYALRSMIMATPGYVLVEADYLGAELFMMAIQANDPVMIDHCLRASLPENHPNFYDIHSNIAVQAFQLTVTDYIDPKSGKSASELLKLPIGSPLPPTKSGLYAIGKSNLRTAAKCVVAGSRLLTTGGWIQPQDLCLDLIEDEAKKYSGPLEILSDVGDTPLIGMYRGEVKPCIRIENEDGFELTTTETHEYRVLDSNGDYAWRAAIDIRCNDVVAILDKAQNFSKGVATFPKIKIERRTCFKDIRFPRKFNKDWAAFLGFYIAEGSSDPISGAVQICQAVDDNPQFGRTLVKLMRRLFGARAKITTVLSEQYQTQMHVTINSVKLARWLDRYVPGYSHTKQVPDFVFKWPTYLQREFISWLFEGDGTAKANGLSYIVNYSTSSKQLAKDVQILLSGHGVYTKRSFERRKGYDHDYWVVSAKSNEARLAFTTNIGFVSKLKQTKCVSLTPYSYDTSEIPGQLRHLAVVQPLLCGKARDKCTECLRMTSVKVRLNRTRLNLITEQLRSVTATDDQQKSIEHLTQLAQLPVRFTRVVKVEAVGNMATYDVQTTSPHSVCYNGMCTHQTLAFGLPYGRGAEAVLRAVEEEGVKITFTEADAIRQAIFDRYRMLEGFLEECARRVKQPGWLISCYGRYRRFQRTGAKDGGEQERQGKNFRIQAGVAGAVNRAINNLYNRDDRYDSNGLLKYRFLLQIHDALLFEVQIPYLEWFAEEVLPQGMTKNVDVWACDMDGKRVSGRDPYHMGIETTVMMNWGSPIDEAVGLPMGIPAKYLKKPD